MYGATMVCIPGGGRNAGLGFRFKGVDGICLNDYDLGLQFGWTRQPFHSES